MAMTKELERYYEDRFEMFTTQGWKDLMDDLEKMRQAADTLRGATPENLMFRQGELNMMLWLLSLKDMSERAYSDLNQEGQDADNA